GSVRQGTQRGIPNAPVDDGGSPPPPILVGVVVAPGLAEEVAARIADDVAMELRARFQGVHWQTAFVVDRLVVPPAAVSEIFEAARRRLLEGGWDIAMVVTDLPLRRAGRPVASQASPAHGVAIVSLPALGAIKLSHRRDDARRCRRCRSRGGLCPDGRRLTAARRTCADSRDPSFG
ncbi:MAG: hypothetical protein QOF68_1542, partial [Gaiellales bacterium]|nr:hypothetical protein [Gaiellales bacterium]